MHSRTLYFRNLLRDLKDHWLVILLVVLACTAAFGLYGYKKAGDNVSLSEEQQEKIDEFKERVASYDDAIADIEKCIADNQEAVENLENYIEHSIYMKLDPNAIKVSSVQYVITVDEGVNLGNVQNSIVSYINDGGLVSSLKTEAGGEEPVAAENTDDSDNNASYGEYASLNPSYWREVTSVSAPANMIVITVLHYDEETGKKILDVIRKQLAAQCDVIRAKQGNFQLTGEEVSTLTKGDVGVANTQNNNINSLRSYTSSRADYEAKFATQTAARDKYIENNQPEEISFPSPKKNAVKFGIFGFIAGVVLVIGALAIRYILSPRIRGQEELAGTGLVMLASVRKKKLTPEAERLSIELEAMLKKAECKGVFVQDLRGGRFIGKKPAGSADASSKGEAYSAVSAVFDKLKDRSAYGFSEGDELKEFNQMRELGAAVLLIECGKTTFAQVDKQLNLCGRSDVRILGYVLYE